MASNADHLRAALDALTRAHAHLLAVRGEQVNDADVKMARQFVMEADSKVTRAYWGAVKVEPITDDLAPVPTGEPS